MTKPYINNAIIGNSRMLGCISEKGELIRLFWPNIDYPQHVDRMLSGVFNTGQQNSTVWLSDDSFSHSQQYVKDTNILETMCVNWDKGVRILQKDYVLTDKDILIRQYEIENIKD
jgi:GH15 family glucan-1,4-alpha-glucosidase